MKLIHHCFSNSHSLLEKEPPIYLVIDFYSFDCDKLISLKKYKSACKHHLVHYKAYFKHVLYWFDTVKY
jgi:hypothetical protein